MSVAEQLPDNSEPVLVCGENVFIAFYAEKHTCLVDCDDGKVDFDEEENSYLPRGWWIEDEECDLYKRVKDGLITHWMPMPKPPKEENND